MSSTQGLRSRVVALEERLQLGEGNMLNRLQEAKNKQVQNAIDGYKTKYKEVVKANGFADHFGKLLNYTVMFVEEVAPIIGNITGVLMKGPLKLDLAIDLVTSVLGALPAAVEVISSFIEELVDLLTKSSPPPSDKVATTSTKSIKKRKGLCSCLRRTDSL